jgi:hypothetical protein
MATRRKQVASCPKPKCKWKRVAPDKFGAASMLHEHLTHTHGEAYTKVS